MQILNCLIGVPKGLDYIFKALKAMNGDCHNPNLPYNLYLYKPIPNKAIKVPLNHKMS
jgi:hypothetical protein